MFGCVKRTWVVALLVAVACGGDEGRSWDVEGVVLDVNHEYQQVLIDHVEIEGFMPAMTMNFDVADAAVLEGVEKGQGVSFRLHYDGQRYTVTRIRVMSGVKKGWGKQEGKARRWPLVPVLIWDSLVCNGIHFSA